MLQKFSLFLICSFFFSMPVFAENVVLNLKTNIYHKIGNKNHCVYSENCLVLEKEKATRLFGANSCKTCFSKPKKKKPMKLKRKKNKNKNKKLKVKLKTEK